MTNGLRLDVGELEDNSVADTVTEYLADASDCTYLSVVQGDRVLLSELQTRHATAEDVQEAVRLWLIQKAGAYQNDLPDVVTRITDEEVVSSCSAMAREIAHDTSDYEVILQVIRCARTGFADIIHQTVASETDPGYVVHRVPKRALIFFLVARAIEKVLQGMPNLMTEAQQDFFQTMFQILVQRSKATPASAA